MRISEILVTVRELCSSCGDLFVHLRHRFNKISVRHMWSWQGCFE